MLYREGDRSIVIDSEYLLTPAIALYSQSIRKWDTPNGTQDVTPEVKARVLDNITRAFARVDKPLIVYGSRDMSPEYKARVVDDMKQTLGGAGKRLIVD